jgi:DnaJ-domain-containing protein 1
MTLLYGIAAVALVWWLSNKFAYANTAAVAKAMKVAGGVLALGAAGVLGLRGRFDMAILLGGLGAWLLGWGGFGVPGFGGRKQRSPGSISRVRSAMIEMELDHDTGDMDGSVLAGALVGRRLSSLDRPALQRLLAECRAADPEGVRLLEAYLDRRFPHWREDAQGNGHPGTGPLPQPGAMTEEEAYQILGLQPGASLDEIRQAHRTLMKKLHPDQGGTTYLATRVNQAKEILLSRHR